MPLTQDQVNQPRNAALLLEKHDVGAARDLMKIALQSRPNGPLIKAKIALYDKKIKFESKEAKHLHGLLRSGELVIIPAGFRCYTKRHMLEDLGVKQQSMPFDNGFFPPNSIAKIIESGKIDLRESEKAHTVCVKYENHEAGNKRVIKFQTSSYEELEELIVSKDQDGLSQYLDATYGYYTLDVKNDYVLAHYNWHMFAANKHSNGITNPVENLQIINATMNKRISRMVNACKSARRVIFAVGEFENYSHMLIDDVEHDLYDYELLADVVRGHLNQNSVVTNYADIDSVEKTLALVG